MNSIANGSTATLTVALSGIRVVSIALNLPGPACARRLADFGATVIKIEPPKAIGGDPMREYARGYYDELHRGVEIQSLNLKSDDGRSALDNLLATADVLITSQREAALERLSLNWDALSARFPRLCHVAIVGSDAGNDAGHDLTYIAAAGLATPPHMPVTLIADLAGGERAVSATFAALRIFQQTGRGTRLAVSLAAAAHAFARPHAHGLTRVGGLLSGGHPGYNFYPARDGWVVLAALEPHFAAHVQAASAVEFTSVALTDYFRQHDVRHWAEWAAQHDIPLATLPSSSTLST